MPNVYHAKEEMIDCVNALDVYKRQVPDMAQSFGTLEFAGESDHVFDRDKYNRRFFARRSYNLYSDVQKGANVVVEIPCLLYTSRSLLHLKMNRFSFWMRHLTWKMIL